MAKIEVPGLTQEDADKLAEAFSVAFRIMLKESLPFARRAITKVTRYPEIYKRADAMPSFFEVGYFQENAKRDYDWALSGGGLISGPFDALPKEVLKACNPLAELLWNTPATRQRFDSDDPWSSEWEAQRIVGNAVRRYFHLYGTEDYNPKHAWRVASPFIAAINSDNLGVALVVPILMHRFHLDRFRLDDDAYILRMRDPFQLARVAGSYGSSVSKSVLGCATHALVITRWSITNMSLSTISSRLSDPPESAFAAVNEFFGALRVATSAVSGYAQLMFVPRGWAYDYKWDLPAVYSSEHRHYPNEYDRAMWQDDHVHEVPDKLLDEVRRTYQQVRAAKENNIELALRRLNACVTRDDDVDAILDSIIGIELLLGGDKSDSITFKLKMRVAALAKLTDGRYEPSTVFKEMGELYATRSDIVHGNTPKKRTRTVEQDQRSRYMEQRVKATGYLRMVLGVLLSNPDYRKPSNIDTDLLINFGMPGSKAEEAQTELPGIVTDAGH